MDKPRFRVDIQILRALAVTAVVFYHTDLGFLPGGYLGVDIFFVISGFLIGGVIMSACDQGSFSFKEFYKRRIFRLVPATLSTLFVTTILAVLLLTHRDWADFQGQLLGALTFTANFFLMFQSDYFSASAELKPLLHMWSLAIEEQFYLFAPVAIYLTPRRWRTIVFLISGLLSAFICFALMFAWIDLPVSSSKYQSIAFYMLPTRAWEMIVGCLGAWLMLKHPKLHIPAPAKWLALLGIIYLLVAPIGSSHPSQDAAFIVFLTLLILLGQKEWLPNSPLIMGPKKIGDWSYSIYLVHWPLFAFSANIFIEGTPILVSILQVLVSVLLGALQYTYVETPFRYGAKKTPIYGFPVLILPVFVLLLISQSNVKNFLHPLDGWAQLESSTAGLSLSCNQPDGRFSNLPECSTSEEPRIALFGDSIAMQWAGVLSESSDEIGGLIQITKTACAPSLGVARVRGRYTQGWAQDCISFVRTGVDWIIENPSIDTVVVSSEYASLILDEGQSILSEGSLGKVNSELGIAASRATLERFIEAGKSVVLIAPPAMTGVDFGNCNVRRSTGLLTVGSANCSFNLEDYFEESGPIVGMLEELGRMEGVTLLWPHEAYCQQNLCQTTLRGSVLYWDSSHLTAEATRMIAEELDFVNIIAQR